MFAAKPDRGDDVFERAWHHDTDRNLAVIGGICGVERPASRIETHFTADRSSELLVQAPPFILGDGVVNGGRAATRRPLYMPFGPRLLQAMIDMDVNHGISPLFMR